MYVLHTMTDNRYARIKIKILQELCIGNINITYFVIIYWRIVVHVYMLSSKPLGFHKEQTYDITCLFYHASSMKYKTRGVYLLWLYNIMQRTQSADSFDFRKYLDARIQHNGNDSIYPPHNSRLRLVQILFEIIFNPVTLRLFLS